jgi:hypothetical protein
MANAIIPPYYSTQPPPDEPFTDAPECGTDSTAIPAPLGSSPADSLTPGEQADADNALRNEGCKAGVVAATGSQPAASVLIQLGLQTCDAMFPPGMNVRAENMANDALRQLVH